jgi:arylsulfatase A-like enzyme
MTYRNDSSIMWRLSLQVTLLLMLGGCGDTARDDLPNILLVTIDTARRDRFGAYGGNVPTPSFDELASRGILCEKAVTPSPITLPSHYSIFTGLYPLHHGVHDNGTVAGNDDKVRLAEILKSAGYCTLAFVGSSVLERGLGCEQGFDHYGDSWETGEPVPGTLSWDSEDWWERPAEEVNAEAVTVLQRSHQPFFAWCHYFDPHSPYSPPPPYAQQYKDNPYDGEIAAVDVRLGELVADVEKLSGARVLVTIILADHGECLGEHEGYIGHAEALYEQVLLIPSVIVWPGVLPAGERFDPLFRTIDLLPTLLDLLDIPAPKNLDGVSQADHLISGKAGPEECFHETCTRPLRNRKERLFAYRVGLHKLWWIESEPKPRCSSTDPETGLDVFRDEIPDALMQHLSPLEEYVHRYFGSFSQDVETETKEKLRRLGY